MMDQQQETNLLRRARSEVESMIFVYLSDILEDCDIAQTIENKLRAVQLLNQDGCETVSIRFRYDSGKPVKVDNEFLLGTTSYSKMLKFAIAESPSDVGAKWYAFSEKFFNADATFTDSARNKINELLAAYADFKKEVFSEGNTFNAGTIVRILDLLNETFLERFLFVTVYVDELYDLIMRIDEVDEPSEEHIDRFIHLWSSQVEELLTDVSSFWNDYQRQL